MPGTTEPSLVEIKRTSSGVYEVYKCASEAEALAFLRRRDVPEAQYYVIVETPLRNVGRDVIGIFDEQTEAQLEFPEHTPLIEPVPSRTNCARCGYSVGPIPPIESPTSGPHTMHVITSLEELMEQGFGYRCTRCSSLACASCYHSTLGAIERDAAGALHPTCWVCGSAVELFKSASE